jgi:uncharacterized protein YjdB
LDNKSVKLYGFNNLTKSLSFNIYDVCYAKTERQRADYIESIDEQYNVHATAFRHDDHTKGLYYLNGEMTVLPSDSWANLEVLGMGLHVTNDGHVYIAGYEVSQSRNFQAMLWKDGVSQNLGSATTYQAQAEAVTVHNGHVYVLGIYINSGGQLESCLWIDGQFAPFGASYRATARSLAVTEDGTLYVGGELGLIAIDVASGTYRDILDASGEYYQDIGGLCAVGNNVYAAGFDDYYYAPAYYYDKYRNKHELPLALSDSSFGEAYGIRVADNGDVYVAGYEYGYWYDWIVWWVNGVVHRADHDTGAYPYDNFAYMAHARGVDTGYVPSTGVTVTGANTTVVIGGTTTLSASVQPAGATNKSMDWSSSNTAVATVRGNGSTATVTGVSDGVAMIKATSYDGAIGACQVTVRKVSVAGVTLTSVPSPMNLNLGYSGNVAATILPANATVRTIHWTSNNPAVASVAPPTGASAVVTANAVGTARITATSPDGPSASLTVNVNTLAATGIRLPAEFAVGLGKTKGLAATIIPAQATNQNATWTSSNTAIATVSGTGLIGSVTGVALGEAIIRVTTLDGGHSASCTVSVLEKADPDIYVAGHFGVYKNGVYDARFPDSDPLSPGSSGMEDVSVDASGAIHTAGFYLDWDHPQHGYTYMFEAAHYIDGRREILEMNHGDDDIESGATSIFVEGMDYYIAGYEYHYEPGTSILDVAPRLWKNGKIQTLQSHEDEGYGEYSFANKVLVKNGSVYVGGYTRYAEDYWERPVLWKDGERHIDMHEEDFRVIDFGVTDNNYIYALMRCAYPSLWGVSTYSVWRISPDYGTWQHQFNMYPAEYGAQKWSELIHLFVDGNDWYVTGYIDDDAYYWKNGEFTPVKMQHPVGLSWVEADDIYVIDGDVYVAGPGGTSDDWIEFYLVQWKNGEIITDGAITDTLPGGGNDYYNHARVRGLHVQ